MSMQRITMTVTVTMVIIIVIMMIIIIIVILLLLLLLLLLHQLTPPHTYTHTHTHSHTHTHTHTHTRTQSHQNSNANPQRVRRLPRVRALLQALLDAGFELTTSCVPLHACNMPKGVRSMPKLPPEEYAQVLGRFAFMLGTGDPTESPSPLEGMAMGVAFINPTDGNASLQLGTGYQHNTIARLGPPFVYNVNFLDTPAVLQAAELTAKHRFPHHLVAEFTPEAAIARACAWFSSDQECICARARREGDDAGMHHCAQAYAPGANSEL